MSLQGFAPQAARCRIANMIVVKLQVRGQKMPVSHWCVVINGTRLQEWHARYRRIVTEGMALTMTSYGRLNSTATVWLTHLHYLQIILVLEV